MSISLIHNRWSWRKLGELCERIDYGFTASADFGLREPRFLRITDIQNGAVDWDKVPGCKISKAEAEINQLRDGDIVFARTGATTGKSFLIRNPPPSVFASYLIRLRLKPGTQPEFLALFFQSELYWEQIRVQARGGAQPSFNASMLSHLRVIHADERDQERVASRLREQFSEVEQARAAVEAQVKADDDFRQVVLRAVFSEQRERQFLRDLCEVLPGRHIVEADHNRSKRGVPYLTGPSDFGPQQAVASRWTEKPDVMCKPNDVLVTVKGAGVGKINFAPSLPACIGRQLMAVRAKPDKTNTYFLFFALQSAREQLRSQSMGATVPGLSIEDLEGLRLPSLSRDKQKRIADRLCKQFEEVRQMKAAAEERLEGIEHISAALLRDAFIGNV